MSSHSLAAQTDSVIPNTHSWWFTTADAARALQLTTDGVRFLARTAQLACTTTPNGQRLYRQDDVLRLAERRTEQRLRGLLSVRPKMLRARGQPQQLNLGIPKSHA